VNGIGLGSGAAGYDYGVYLNGSSSKVTSINSNISITGTGGSGTGGSNYGVNLLNNATVYTTGSGNIALVGIGGNGNMGIVSSASSGNDQIGGASDTGSITFTADTISLASTPIQTTGTVTFAPYTASDSIGFAGGSGTLQVTQAIMNDVKARPSWWARRTRPGRSARVASPGRAH
jgi:hypothetical protein